MGEPSRFCARVITTSAQPSACTKSCAVWPMRRSGGVEADARAHGPVEERVRPVRGGHMPSSSPPSTTRSTERRRASRRPRISQAAVRRLRGDGLTARLAPARRRRPDSRRSGPRNGAALADGRDRRTGCRARSGKRPSVRLFGVHRDRARAARRSRGGVRDGDEIELCLAVRRRRESPRRRRRAARAASAARSQSPSRQARGAGAACRRVCCRATRRQARRRRPSRPGAGRGAAQHADLERGSPRAPPRARAAEPHQRMREQREQPDRAANLGGRFRGQPREAAGRRFGQRQPAESSTRDVPAREFRRDPRRERPVGRDEGRGARRARPGFRAARSRWPAPPRARPPLRRWRGPRSRRAQGRPALARCDQRPAVGGVGRTQGLREQAAARLRRSGAWPSTGIIATRADAADRWSDEPPQHGLRMAVHRSVVVVAQRRRWCAQLSSSRSMVEAGQHDGAVGQARDGGDEIGGRRAPSPWSRPTMIGRSAGRAAGARPPPRSARVRRAPDRSPALGQNPRPVLAGDLHEVGG